MEKSKIKYPKIGDEIVVTKCGSAGSCYPAIGKISKVTGCYPASGYFQARFANDSAGYTAFTVYIRTEVPDEWVPASRDARVKALQNLIKDKKDKIATLNEEIVKYQKDIEHIKKYATEEDFVAAKLSAILKSEGNEKKIAEILKTMKETHYL